MTADTTLPELEAWLDAHQVTWELVPDIDILSVDVVAGLANQARLTSLNEDVVDRYAADMAAGARFPPVVLNRVGGRLIPVGGNHRLAAARRAGVATLPAYVLDEVDDTTVHLLAIEDNRRHGLPLTDEERLHHAVHLTQTDHTPAEAADVCGISLNKLHRHLRANNASRRAVRLDVDGWAALSVTARAQLDSITDDAAFAHIVRLAVDGTVLAGEVGPVVARVNAAVDVAAARRLLTDLERASAGRTRRGVGRPPSADLAPRLRLLADLDGVMRFDPAAVARNSHTPEQRAQVAAQCKAAARHLMAIEKALRLHIVA
ncbi:ParB/RepB/Spo0J family partition protein [Iamia sp.]|uniref:ParB/RepB/Spo0J family partition protein n=1 Tax=Iamia sp. TaxID=2722710 RepID=UPI002C156709|nr:ParB/RepB/Spo0J family partition protein [Iamia sp.]HXH58446.1 ParB/RepB/Spo0J family partition protein [Iamia sp.]